MPRAYVIVGAVFSVSAFLGGWVLAGESPETAPVQSVIPVATAPKASPAPSSYDAYEARVRQSLSDLRGFCEEIRALPLDEPRGREQAIQRLKADAAKLPNPELMASARRLGLIEQRDVECVQALQVLALEADGYITR